MASDQNEAQLVTYAPRHAGVKRSRTQESLPPRKSARLEALYQNSTALVGEGSKGTRHDSNNNARKEKDTQHQQKPPASRKCPRAQKNGPTSPEEPSSNERRKRRRRPATETTSIPPSRGSPRQDYEHPIAYWAVHERWPRPYFERGKDMENILARKRSISSRSRKHSGTDSAPSSSADQGEPKSREQKSAEYKRPQYEAVLATKGIMMKPSTSGVTTASKRWCKVLLEQEHSYPEDTLFEDDIFASTCETVRNRNETRVVRDIALLIVPSAEVFAIRGAQHLQCLIDSVNEGWTNSVRITNTRPQPDYAVGFRRETFTQEQLDRMHPIIGDFRDESFFMATWYMYFPFLTCEVKCGTAALDIADRQNAHSAAIAVRAVVELFRAVKREQELHQEILAFSISHDHRSVRIYGYYAEIVGSGTKYYRHPIHTFDFTALDGKEKWTAYKFTKSVYDNWMPIHLKRICSAIDQIPADISFSVSRSEYRFPETSSCLSKDVSTCSVVQSSAGSASAPAHDGIQSSIDREPIATSGTSVTDRESKKQRRETARRRGK